MKKRIIAAAAILLCMALAALLGWAAFLRDPAAAPVDRDGATSDEATADETGTYLKKGATSGYVTIVGHTYYYADGEIQKGGIVGSDEDGYTVADADGICCTSEEIRLAADFMMKYCEGDTLKEKVKTGFQYLADHIPYQRSYEHDLTADDMPAMAIDMFTNLKGNCYRYAACFACIAKVAGYRVRVVLGTTAGNPHGWVEMLVGKKWLICDPDTQMAEKHLPDYFAFKMEKHCWQVTPQKRIELRINEHGVAVWE